MTSKRGLGRGLSALFGEAKKVDVNSENSSNQKYLPISDLNRNKFQPRTNFDESKLEELAKSIKQSGVIQPIAVRDDSGDPGKFEIIAGERRWLAAQKAGLHKVPVVILNLSDNQTLEVALVENIQRENLNVVEEAKANLGPQGTTSAGQPIVNLSMNSDGARKWAIMTGSNVGRQVAIVLDKKVHMAPNIREKISGGGTLIEGFANIDEAKDIAIVLRAGALPAPVEIIEERVIGPSLGAESVKSGTLSVLIGLVIVLVCMIFYYRTAGTIADFALVWNIVLVLAILASLQATLTLPGIAGLILTVGMSIDANVIIFERIREELDKGKTAKAAIDGGYNRALTTIIDANMTTLIAALVLWQFGTGPIRGFATVLFWGILISMFTAIFVTRTIFNAYVNRNGFSKLSI